MKLNIQLFAYTKTEWKDLPDETTPITAEKLNNIENGVEANDTVSTKNTENIKTNTADIEANKLSIANLLTTFGLSVDTWVSGTSYEVGKQVVYNGIIYKCTTANSDTTFDVTKWSVVPILVPDDV